MKRAIPILILLALIGGGYYWWTTQNSAEALTISADELDTRITGLSFHYHPAPCSLRAGNSVPLNKYFVHAFTCAGQECAAIVKAKRVCAIDRLSI